MNADPKCPCGCGASLRGWSHAGRYRRHGVARAYRAEHGHCQLCGLPLDQYHCCEECGDDSFLGVQGGDLW